MASLPPSRTSYLSLTLPCLLRHSSNETTTVAIIYLIDAQQSTWPWNAIHKRLKPGDAHFVATKGTIPQKLRDQVPKRVIDFGNTPDSAWSIVDEVYLDTAHVMNPRHLIQVLQVIIPKRPSILLRVFQLLVPCIGPRKSSRAK